MTKPASSFINGRWVEGTADTTSRFNPSAPEEAVTTYHQAGSEELAQAIQAAADAAPAWDRLGILARGRILAAARFRGEKRIEIDAVAAVTA
ncbi:aldehyde dehydrogenase family protein [Pseudarthrobacter sp. H2]|uniref:aldehyde dehydrogenase family protein n=1 Tax=Pseudarthrobacter sp. H2 TaxID=3418415 RepID=UPI003CF0E8F0